MVEDMVVAMAVAIVRENARSRTLFVVRHGLFYKTLLSIRLLHITHSHHYLRAL